MLEALPDTLQSWTPDELEGSLSANNFNQPERSEQLGGTGKKFMGSNKKTNELCPARTDPDSARTAVTQAAAETLGKLRNWPDHRLASCYFAEDSKYTEETVSCGSICADGFVQLAHLCTGAETSGPFIYLPSPVSTGDGRFLKRKGSSVLQEQ